MGGSFLKEDTNRWGGRRKDTGWRECWCHFRPSSMVALVCGAGR